MPVNNTVLLFQLAQLFCTLSALCNSLLTCFLTVCGFSNNSLLLSLALGNTNQHFFRSISLYSSISNLICRFSGCLLYTTYAGNLVCWFYSVLLTYETIPFLLLLLCLYLLNCYSISSFFFWLFLSLYHPFHSLKIH